MKTKFEIKILFFCKKLVSGRQLGEKRLIDLATRKLLPRALKSVKKASSEIKFTLE